MTYETKREHENGVRMDSVKLHVTDREKLKEIRLQVKLRKVRKRRIIFVINVVVVAVAVVVVKVAR